MNRKPYIIPSKTNNKNMERYLHKKLSEVGEGGESIKYTEQELTAEQQAQARENIGAGTYSKPSGGIPASDIASNVIPDVSGKEDVSNKVNTISSNPSTDKYPSEKAVYDVLGDIETLINAL